MNKGLFLRVSLCIFFLGGCLYSYINMQNEITELKIYLPELTSNLSHVEEENIRLLYQRELFENPQNLMKFTLQNEFAHLQYPLGRETIRLISADASQQIEINTPLPVKTKPSITFATGPTPKS